jgi:trimeric autotransporter adhesin
MKHLLLFGAVLIYHCAIGQRVLTTQTSANVRYQTSLPENVIYYEGFENSNRPNLPSGWTTQTLGTIGFVTGTGGSSAGQANENGFWAVPNHGIFAMANDDVCNCDKSKDRLTSQIFDFSDIGSLNIRFSAFQNGSGGQEASIEIKSDGFPWTTLGKISSSLAWKTHNFQVPENFLKAGFQFRFLYDDAGNYASGLAIDDIYLFEGNAETFSIEKFYSINGNDLGSGQLFETIPLSQAREAKLQFGALTSNSALSRKNARLHVTSTSAVTYDKTSSNWMLSSSSKKTIYIGSSDAFTPYEKGAYSILATLESDSADTDLSDNTFNASFSVVDSVYSHVALSAENSTGVWLQGSGDHYGSVFHFHRTDSIVALKTRIHPSSEAGAKFKIEIFQFDSINQQPLYSSTAFEVLEQHLGFDMRIPLNIEIQKGKHLVVFKKEPGPKRLIIGVNKNKEALDSNVLYRVENESWKQLPYFPKSSLIFKALDTNCLGTIQYTLNHELCVGAADGIINLDPIGMTAPISYAWSNFAGNTSSISDLNPGTYIVTVSDGSPCEYSKSFVIDSASSLKVNPTLRPDSCGKQIGSIDLNISSGTAPYTILWNLDTLSDIESGLGLGQYAIQISDDNNCVLDTMISLPGSEALDIEFLITEPNCSANDGEITATINGTPPFTLLWNNGSSASTRQNIAAGIYTLQATDSLGCSISETAHVKNANAPSLIVSEANGPLCGNASTGDIILTVFGGTAPYNFQWSNGSFNQNLSDLPSGKYVVTVSDNLSCLNFAEVQLADQSSSISSSFNSRGVYCNDDSTGAAEVITYGGTMPYSYNWSNGNQTNALENIPSGNYSLTITDSNGCVHNDTIQISDGAPFFITLDSVFRDTSASIFPGNDVFISTYGGTQPYQYNWNDSLFSEDLINVPTDTYALVLTDQLGCAVYFEYLLENGSASITKVVKSNSILVYPNPASSTEQLHIKSQNPVSSITLRDSSGRLLRREYTSSKELSISLERLLPGLYFLETRTVDSQKITPIVIN